MNGAELSAIAVRLEQALERAGIRIERGEMDRSGNRRRWIPVSGQEVVVALLAKRWVIGEVKPVEPRILSLDRQ